MSKRAGILVTIGLVLVSGSAVADQADPFTLAKNAYFSNFDSKENITLGRLDAMWKLSPKKSLAALRERIDAGPGDMPVVLIAMSAQQVHDPRLADLLIAEHDRASDAVKQDIVNALAPYDGADDHVAAFLRKAGAGNERAAAALEKIDARDRLGFADTAVFVKAIADATYVPLREQDILRGLAIHLDGEVTSEGNFRALVGGTQVRATFERDDEARAEYAPGPKDWVHLEGVLRATLPGEDNGGKYVELALSYAALTPSTAPRTPTTKPAKKSGCGCASGDASGWPVALLFLALLGWYKRPWPSPSTTTRSAPRAGRRSRGSTPAASRTSASTS